MSRKSLLGKSLMGTVFIAALLSGCSHEAASPDYPLLRYNYLRPIDLNVASIEIRDDWLPRDTNDVARLSPEPPEDALKQMAHDRLVAAGKEGKALFEVEEASIRREGQWLYGHLAVRLTVTGKDPAHTGYAEAAVARNVALPEDAENKDAALRQTLYDMTKAMMDNMNVEFEYQVRHALHDWILDSAEGGIDVPKPVESQPLN
jgi:hypothetical protein